MRMSAVRWHDRLDVRYEEVLAPGEPGKGMVLVDVSLCGLCGTDLTEYLHGPVLIRRTPHPLTGRSAPLTMGHEFVGRVAAVGSGVEGIEVGERVTADACWRCGRCEFCLRGDYHQCRLGGSIGLHSDGALASQALVPDYTVVAVPDSVDDRAAALTEPMAIGIHALDKAGASSGDTVVVVGFGPIGATAALAASLAGLRVIIVEALDGRRAFADRLGFSEVIDPAGVDLRREVRSVTRGMGAEAVIDCTGKQALAAESLELVKRMGTLVLVGLGSGPAEIDANRIVLFERRIVGSLGYNHDLPRALAMMATGALAPDALVSEEINLSEAVEGGLKALAEDPGGHLKILIRCN